jgi:chemotaxis protein CheZ
MSTKAEPSENLFQKKLIEQVVAAVTSDHVVDAIGRRVEDRLRQAVKDVVDAEMAVVRTAIDARIASLDERLLAQTEILRQTAQTAAEQSEMIDSNLGELANRLEMAKVELAGIRHPRGNEDQLAMALFELDEIISATQSATGVILNAAEKILNLVSQETTDKALAAKIANEMMNEATKIFEACNFQDLTGQRVQKVVDTFLKIEEHMNAIVKGLGKDSFDHIPVGEERHASRDGTMLTGPAQENMGNNQDDVDALFG